MQRFFIFFLCVFATCYGQFNKVVIWGHKLHSHTHSYIHDAFYKAFKYLGYDTYCFDNEDVIDDVDFSNTLFLTEGQVDQKIPIRDDCYYILHNCNAKKYSQVVDSSHLLTIQVYTKDVRNRQASEGTEEIKPYIFQSRKSRIMYFPWGTDLLPNEIDECIHQTRQTWRKDKGSYVAWVGTIGDGVFGNLSEVMGFQSSTKRNRKLKWIQKSRISTKEHQRFISKAAMAPTIVGSWQKNKDTFLVEYSKIFHMVNLE